MVLYCCPSSKFSFLGVDARRELRENSLLVMRVESDRGETELKLVEPTTNASLMQCPSTVKKSLLFGPLNNWKDPLRIPVPVDEFYADSGVIYFEPDASGQPLMVPQEHEGRTVEMKSVNLDLAQYRPRSSELHLRMYMFSKDFDPTQPPDKLRYVEGTVISYIVFQPPNFRFRIWAFLASIWLVSNIGHGLLVFGSIAVGRHVAKSITHLHDIYAFSIGFLILWGIVFLFSVCYRFCNEIYTEYRLRQIIRQRMRTLTIKAWKKYKSHCDDDGDAAEVKNAFLFLSN